MLHSDQPIKSISDDILNRGVFSKELANAITLYTQKENLVVGLCGRWGCGKTSILNLVTEEIEKITETRPDEEKPIIIRFNPWNYSDCTQLISQFFETLSATLKTQDFGNSLLKVGEALEKYSSIMEYTQYIPGVGTYLKPLADLTQSTGELMGQCGDREKSIDVQKEKVIKALDEQKRKFIVVIDDIDRLNNNQIRAIFQLVNSVAGFPNMLYLLAFDREVVTRALEQEQGCDGEMYLEKIIQVPFDVPEVNLELVSRAFIDRYLEIIHSGVGTNDFDESYWGKVYGICIRPYIKSIRDSNRILKTFEFKYNLMRAETNPIDLLVITVLSIYSREIYEWIRINKSYLVGEVQRYKRYSGKEQKENKERYLEEFSSIDSEHCHRILEMIQILFPKFAWETGSYYYSDESEDDLRRKKRLASSDKFKIYYCLSMEDIPVTNAEIKKSFFELDESQFKKFLHELVERNSIDYYLNELQARVQEIPKERYIMMVNILVSFSNDVVLQDDNYQFHYIPRRTFLTIIERFLENRNKKENADLIINLLNNSTKDSLTIIAELLNDIKCSFEDKQYYFLKKQVINVENLQKIQEVFLENVQLKIKNVLCVHNNTGLIYLWTELDKDNYDEHVRGLMSDAINVPKLLLLFAGTWSNSNGEAGWSFNEDNFGKYISSDKAYEAICSLKEERFIDLDDREKKIAVAYVLWYKSEGKSDSINSLGVSLSRVMKELKKWEIDVNLPQ